MGSIEARFRITKSVNTQDRETEEPVERFACQANISSIGTHCSEILSSQNETSWVVCAFGPERALCSWSPHLYETELTKSTERRDASTNPRMSECPMLGAGSWPYSVAASSTGSGGSLAQARLSPCAQPAL